MTMKPTRVPQEYLERTIRLRAPPATSRGPAGGTRRALAVGIVVALAMAGLFTYAGHAEYGSFAGRAASEEASLTLSSSSGAPGAPIFVTLAGFPADYQAWVNMTNSSVPGYNVESDPEFYINESGGASQQFAPAYDHMSAGSYTFTAYDPNILANLSAAYTVTSSNASFAATANPGCGGSSVSFSGSGYASGVPTYVYVGPVAGTPDYDYLGEVPANATGNVSGSVTFPTLTTGTYNFWGEDAYGNYAASSFTCSSVSPPTPAVSLSPIAGPMGISATLTGSGYTADASISVEVVVFFTEFDQTSRVCDNLHANSTGGFECTFKIPAKLDALYDRIYATGSNGEAAAHYEIVAPDVDLSPTTAQPGATVSVDGSGFAPRSLVTATLGATTVGCQQTSNSLGEFACHFVVPVTSAGPVSLNVYDKDYNTASSTFTVAALPTTQFPAYLLTVEPSGGTALPGVEIKGVNGFLMNRWSFGEGFLFNGSTNLTSESFTFYLDATDGDAFHTNLTGFVLAADPDSTAGAQTVVEEFGSIVLQGATAVQADLLGGSGSNATLAFSLESTKIGFSPRASAISEPSGPYPVDLISISPNGSNPESNPITIDGVSGSWSFNWWLDEAAKAKNSEFNATVLVSIGNEWLVTAIDHDSETLKVFEISSASGPIVVELKIKGKMTTSSPFEEWAIAGGLTEFSETLPVSSLSWEIGS